MSVSPTPARPACDWCDDPAGFALYAAYEADLTLTHPTWAVYPMPLAYVCAAHVAACIRNDQSVAGATPRYLLRVLDGEP